MIGDITTLPFPRYERRGQCNRCGWCCQFEDCEHFTPSEDGELAICQIHDDKDRPSKCKDYPANPPIQSEDCGYYFWDRWEKKEVRWPRDL